MNIRKASRYLKDVVAKKQIVPFRRYNGGVGRKAQVSCLNILSIVVNQLCLSCSVQESRLDSGSLAQEECSYSSPFVEECREQC